MGHTIIIQHSMSCIICDDIVRVAVAMGNIQAV